ncbi:ParB-N-terminal-like domain methyltransferase [Gordonia phage Evaa]|nr:ParB-N-terminal-like domain methyltransferase [Gordonia phage Evaa]
MAGRPNVVRLVDADDIRPSTYNPRQADPERLELVALSLRKLGWMLPIYADAAGEILSGHQRHYVATEMLGLTRLPVVYTKPFDLETRKAINIAFNRGTNDMAADTLSTDLRSAIIESGVIELAQDMPDAADMYPVLTASDEPIKPILTANRGRWNRHARNVSRMLSGRGIEMPLILDENDQVVNGIGRLEFYAAKARDTVPVIRVAGKTAELAKVMLNLLTMDFDLHTRYQNELRYNSFRRTAHTRDTLGLGFTFAVIGSKPANTLQVSKPAHLTAWKRVHGTKIVDFGAGHMDETRILRGVGIDVTPFEPFMCDPDHADTLLPDVSRSLGRALLERVASGYQWDSVFISSVLNSVPFLADRQHIITLLAAMTGEGKCYAVTKSTGHGSWRAVQPDAAPTNAVNDRQLGFQIGYEDGTILTDFGDQPKAQKYHTLEEFRDLFGTRFERVHAAHSQSNCQVIAETPRPVDPVALAAACDFEFDVAYPDGTSMGLADVAREAFGRRHGVDLSR